MVVYLQTDRWVRVVFVENPSLGNFLDEFSEMSVSIILSKNSIYKLKPNLPKYKSKYITHAAVIGIFLKNACICVYFQ